MVTFDKFIARSCFVSIAFYYNINTAIFDGDIPFCYGFNNFNDESDCRINFFLLKEFS